MVNGVPGEVLRPKPEGPQAPRDFGRGTSQVTQFTMIVPWLFHIMSFFWHPKLVYRIAFSQWSPKALGTREYHGQYI